MHLPEALPKASELLRLGIRQGLHLGAQLHVRRGGRPVADLAFGEAAPGIPMTTQTSQLWFSCSKPIAAVALGKLIEAGDLNLDDPVAEYIPQFAQGGKDEITVRQVLMHTGGFRGSNQIDLSWNWDRILQFICETVRETGWVPGQKAGYHHTGSWFVLAEIIQRLDGRPYSLFVREEIFLPLEMNQSWVGMPESEFARLGDRCGRMYQMGEGQAAPVPYWQEAHHSVACRPGSNGRGPIRELAWFMEMVLQLGSRNGRRILLPDTVKHLISRHRAGMYDETFMQYLDWGLGFLLNTQHPGQRMISYGMGAYASLNAFGHGGMQSSVVFADPVHDLVVAWSCNGMCGERLHRQRNHALNTAIYEDLGCGSSIQ